MSLCDGCVVACRGAWTWAARGCIQALLTRLALLACLATRKARGKLLKWQHRLLWVSCESGLMLGRVLFCNLACRHEMQSKYSAVSWCMLGVEATWNHRRLLVPSAQEQAQVASYVSRGFSSLSALASALY